MSSATLEVDKGLTANLDQRLKNITNAIERKKTGSDQKNSMKTIQAKLAKSHEISLKLVIDVSRLLRKYQEYFDKLDEQLKKVNVDFSRDDAEYLQRFSNTSMSELTNRFTRHIESLKRYYETNGYPSGGSEMSRLKELENLHSTLLTDIRYINSSGKSPIESEKKNNEWFTGIKFFNKTGGSAKKKTVTKKKINKDQSNKIKTKTKTEKKSKTIAKTKAKPKVKSTRKK